MSCVGLVCAVFSAKGPKGGALVSGRNAGLGHVPPSAGRQNWAAGSTTNGQDGSALGTVSPVLSMESETWGDKLVGKTQ